VKDTINVSVVTRNNKPAGESWDTAIKSVDKSLLCKAMVEGLNPFFSTTSYSGNSIFGDNLYYNTVAPYVVMYRDEEELMSYMDLGVMNSILVAATSTASAAGTEARTEEIKSRLSASGITSFHQFTSKYNNREFSAQLGSRKLFPRYIYSKEEFDNRFVVLGTGNDSILCKKSNKWIISSGVGNIIVRNGDTFILPASKKATIEEACEFLMSISEAPNLFLREVVKGNITSTISSNLPGKVYKLPEFTIDVPLLDELCKDFGITKASLRKHEKFLEISNYLSSHKGTDNDLPKLYQIVLKETSPTSEELSKKDYLVALLRAMPITGTNHFVGGKDMPAIPERISVDGQYAQGMLIELLDVDEKMEAGISMASINIQEVQSGEMS
jgi:hypothetical protein